MKGCWKCTDIQQHARVSAKSEIATRAELPATAAQDAVQRCRNEEHGEESQGKSDDGLDREAKGEISGAYEQGDEDGAVQPHTCFLEDFLL